MTVHLLRRRLRQVFFLSSISSLIVPLAPAFAAEDTGGVTEIVVTGSRIKRDDTFSAPTPVAVIEGSAINESGLTMLGDALTNLPQSLANSNIQNTSGTLFNAGESRADLRGLGSARTLVLVDGRRHLTGDFRTSAVDLNVFPSTMVERIEAISGGASAVYGSEAIAGVVNVILKKKIDGLLVDVQGGMTGHHDGQEWKLAAAWGTPFAGGRGSFLIGGEYGKAEPILQVDRSWAFPGIRRNNAVNPQTVVPASRTNTMPTATFQLTPTQSISIALDRSTSYVNSAACATATVSALCQDPWLFYGATYNALQGEVDRKTARAYVDFNLTDKVTAFGDLSFADVHGFGIFQPAFTSASGGGTLPAILRGDNAYLNGSTALDTLVRTQWQNAGLTLARGTTVSIGKFWSEFGNRNADTARYNYRLVSGLQGKLDLFSSPFDWEVYGQYGELRGRTIGYSAPNIQRTLQELDAVVVGGQVVCNDAAARAAGCQPWNLIDGPSQAAVNWANADARADGKATQTVFAANASGEIVELPGGALGVAVGAEYRRETSDQIQDPLSASGALFYNAIGRTRGEYKIKEGFAEVSVPIVKDLPGIYRLSAEAAGRIGDYSTVGNVNQWRFQASWAPIEDASFRWSLARSVRAPNITELYGPQGQNFTTAASDPCDKAQVAGVASDPARQAIRIANCAATIPGYNAATFTSNFGPGQPSLQLLQGGNPNLFEESASTLTVGMIVKPRFIPEFNLSLDYWRIRVKDAVALIPINSLLQNLCYDAPQAPSANRFCSLILRDQTGALTGRVGGVSQVILTNQNVQSIETSGYDLAAQYSHDFGVVGLFQIRGDLTKVIRFDLIGIPGGPVTHFAGAINGTTSAIPTHKAVGSLGWTKGPVAIQWQTQYLDSFGESEVDLPASRQPFFSGSYLQHEVRGSYRVNESLSIRAGILNVTDEHPPLIPEIGNATGTGGSSYDNRGRWYYIGANYKLGAK